MIEEVEEMVEDGEDGEGEKVKEVHEEAAFDIVDVKEKSFDPDEIKTSHAYPL